MINNYDSSKLLFHNQNFDESNFFICAPEVFLNRNFKNFSSASDIWSFGIIMFEMMTNTNPFSEKTFENVKSMLVGNSLSTKLRESIKMESYKMLMGTFEASLQEDPKNRISLLELKEKFVDLL